MELLQALLARPATPMLVVLTGRGALPDADHRRGARAHPSHGEDAASLVRAVAPSLDDEVVERVVAGSNGDPYFLEEQARAAQEAPDGATGAPMALSVFLAARLDELGPRSSGCWARSPSPARPCDWTFSRR